MSQSKAINRIVARVSADLGDGATAERLFAQKTEVAALLRERSRRRPVRRVVMATAALLVLSLGSLWLYRDGQPAPLAYAVRHSGASGTPGDWILAAATEGVRYEFDQGSRIDVQAKSKTRVLKSDEDQVQMEIANGGITADIVGNEHTRWVVNAGRWRITVLGTRFSVDWQSQTEVLEVTVFRGKVLVQGPGETDAGVAVTGGYQFLANGQQRSLLPQKDTLRHKNGGSLKSDVAPVSDVIGTGREASDPVAPVAAPDDGAKTPKPALVAQGTRSSGAETVVPRQNSRLDWLVHYANGEYDRAVESASAYGVDRLAEELNAVRLWKLQDAARISKHYSLSTRILHRFRERFPRHPNARVAAFLLGRISMDKKQFSTASRWFNRYISEDSNGPLAEEAHGLLILVFEKTGEARLAQKAARQYLNRYRGGAFAHIAARQLEPR
jgi:ferric-dicitrate binding protein FerR (iron transport regulator)